MSFEQSLRCRECGRDFPLKPIFFCEFCFGPLEVAYDYEGIANAISRESIAAGPATLWRYADLLPSDPEYRVDLAAGFTPLLPADRLAKALGIERLWIKNDTVNPTWSFKDRVVAVAIAKAREFGYTGIACASTGNLANSVAAHGARAGMETIVFIPQDLEEGKVVGSGVYNPTLVMVEGSYDDVNRLCTEVAQSKPWAFVNINVRPYYAEGSRTLAFEVAEQLGWRTPDHCVVPMASGLALHEDLEGLQGAAPGRPDRRAADAHVGRAGDRLLADRDRLRGGHAQLPAAEAEHDRALDRDRQPGGRVLCAQDAGGDGRRRGDGHGRGDRRGHEAARGDRGHLRRDGGRHDDRLPQAHGSNAARSRPARRPSPSSPAAASRPPRRCRAGSSDPLHVPARSEAFIEAYEARRAPAAAAAGGA